MEHALPQWMDTLLVVGPFLLSALLAPRVVAWCAAQGMLAEVTSRSSHAAPLVQGVGVLFPLIAVPIGLALLWGFGLAHQLFLTLLLLASLPLALVGWLDDKHNVSPWWRFGVQLLVVALGVWALPELFETIPNWLEKAILTLAWVWFINLYNFMDGIDGQALTEAAFIAIVLAFLVPPLRPLALVIGATALGLLRVNWHPSKAIIGDVGATWLGYVLGGLLLLAVSDATWAKHTWDAAFVLFTLTLGFSADATYTLFKRVLGGHKFWQPHKAFWFHRAVAVGMSHGAAVRRLLLQNVLYVGCALIGLAFGAGWLSLLLGLAVFTAFCHRLKYLERS